MSLQAYGNLCSLFYDVTKGYALEREVDFYSSFIPNKNARVLEAMCGSGRVMIPLMQRGYQVEGIDNSKNMLDRCRRRCAELGLSPILHEQSLETMLSPNRYDVVTIAVGSFQLITNRSAALVSLKNLHAHMNEGGILLIDTFVPDVNGDPWTVRYARMDAHKTVRLTTRHVFDAQKKIADAYCLYELLIDGIVQQEEKELIQVTWYRDKEFEFLLRKAGFKLVNISDENLRPSGPSRIVHAVAV